MKRCRRAGADASEVKKAYRSLSKQHHPDKNPHAVEESEKRMAEINEAYETLTKILKRRERGGTRRGRD